MAVPPFFEDPNLKPMLHHRATPSGDYIAVEYSGDTKTGLVWFLNGLGKL